MKNIPRLKASTLPETLVSLVIILAIMSIATSFFVQVNGTSFVLQKLKAMQCLDQYANETNEAKIFIDEEISVSDGVMRREIVMNSLKAGVIAMKFSYFDANHNLIASQQRLFYTKTP